MLFLRCSSTYISNKCRSPIATVFSLSQRIRIVEELEQARGLFLFVVDTASYSSNVWYHRLPEALLAAQYILGFLASTDPSKFNQEIWQIIQWLSGGLDLQVDNSSTYRSPPNLKAVPYKLTTYTQRGSKAQAHRATPKSNSKSEREELLGTLLLRLPSTFTGGALSPDHPLGTRAGAHYRLGRRHIQISRREQPSWAFFVGGLEHEALPVTSGVRLTLAYDIFWAEAEAEPKSLNIMDLPRIPFYQELKTRLADLAFCQGGCSL
ncbi:hypothetical protein M422DRAFT_242522 [Sphaerobolus stellatus SS14]|nr:hypothetical protein M422DRAFT_242522 [Sphaerobolus stellatus SS14]